MLKKEIFDTAPGAVTLLYCAEEQFDGMIHDIISYIPDEIRERALLNSENVISMELCGDDKNNSFHDLAVLCERLITAAGRRSRFEGVLLLNIAGLLKRADDHDRLRALGEVLSLENGPASECNTLVYGPTNESDVLIAADALDFNGRLVVKEYKAGEKDRSAETLLRSAGLRASSAEIEVLLQSTIDDMRHDKRFEPMRYIRSCRPENGVVTYEGVMSALKDPFSYANRLKRSAENTSREPNRVIGFTNDR